MKQLHSIMLLITIVLAASCKEDEVIYNTAARADFTTIDDAYEVDQSIVFTDASVPNKDGRIVSWLWKFGDKAESVSTEQNPVFSYTTDGSFTVQLIVTDNNGLKASTSKTLTIIDPTKAINVMWQRPLLGAIENTVSPAISPDGNTVYMYADQSGANAYDVQLKAYDIATGTEKWSFNVNDALATKNPGGGVRLVYASPSVGPNGDIYVAVRDLKSSGAARKSFMFAIKADGTLHWSYALGIDGNFNYITPAIDAQGRIYLGHLTNKPFAVAVIEPENGEAVQTIETPVGICSGLSLSKSGDIYFCSTGSEGLLAYGKEGTNKFQFNSLFSITGGAIAVGAEGTLYTVGGTTSGGAIAAINADGTQKWVVATPGTIQYGGVVIGADGTIYANGGKAVEGATSAGIVAINKDGSLKWRFGTEDDVNNCVPLVDNRGYVHFVSDAAVYYIVKPDGTLFASSKLGVKTNASPVMDNKGNLFIGVETEAGVSSMLCIQSGAKSFADSEWPMKGQNPQRTGLQK